MIYDTIFLESTYERGNTMEKIKEHIYEAMLGMYKDEEDYIVDGIKIKDEFAEGERCEELYQYVFDANRRLCERLQVDEDQDVETIIMRLDDITKELAMKMFDYGMQFAQRK